MATKPSDNPFGPLGSAYRRGCDDPTYQIDRLRKLCAFSARLIDTYTQQLRDQQRHTRQIWDAKNFHEQQTQHLESEIATLKKMTEEQRAWIAKLEESHAKAIGELKDWISKLEEAKVHLAQQLESEKAKYAGLKAIIDKLRGTWIGKIMIHRIKQTK